MGMNEVKVAVQQGIHDGLLWQAEATLSSEVIQFVGTEVVEAAVKKIW